VATASAAAAADAEAMPEFESRRLVRQIQFTLPFVHFVLIFSAHKAIGRYMTVTGVREKFNCIPHPALDLRRLLSTAVICSH
jgi:hypothetical protein